jgi:hypothetical protein
MVLNTYIDVNFLSYNLQLPWTSPWLVYIQDIMIHDFNDLTIYNISVAQIYMWIWSNALYIKYYAYLR